MPVYGFVITVNAPRIFCGPLWCWHFIQLLNSNACTCVIMSWSQRWVRIPASWTVWCASRAKNKTSRLGEDWTNKRCFTYKMIMVRDSRVAHDVLFEGWERQVGACMGVLGKVQAEGIDVINNVDALYNLMTSKAILVLPRYRFGQIYKLMVIDKIQLCAFHFIIQYFSWHFECLPWYPISGLHKSL